MRRPGVQVKQEYVALFRKYAPLWEAEEVERQERWDAFLSPGSNGGTPGRLGGRRSVRALSLQYPTATQGSGWGLGEGGGGGDGGRGNAQLGRSS